MTPEQEKILRAIKSAMAGIDRAEGKLDRLLHEARQAKIPLRTIGATLGVNHQTVVNRITRAADLKPASKTPDTPTTT
jgi:hypothetical protein